MLIPSILVGLALLIFGRQLFWLFVGGVGFVAGMTLATDWIHGQPDWVVLMIAILAGIMGALLSIFLQRFAIGAAGFFAGGYALLTLVGRIGRADLGWVAFLVGAIIGALLVLFLFDWALIVLSSLTGAMVIVDALHWETGTSLIVFLGLFVAGVAFQARQLSRRPPEPARASN